MPDGGGEEGRRRDDPHLGALPVRARHGVGDVELAHARAQQPVQRVAQEEAVRRRDVEPVARAGLAERADALHQRAAGGDHVVHEEAPPAAHLAHQVGDGGLGAALPLLVQHDERQAQSLRVLVRHRHAAGVGRDHHGVVERVAQPRA